MSGCVIFSNATIKAKDNRPNIVVLFADDLGYSDIGCYGGEIETPNLDALAGEGLRFTQFVNQSKCAPSRASLLTGLYAVEAGCMGPPEQMVNGITIAELLKQAGYHTLMAGKWHASENPVKRGFDHYFGICSGAANYFYPGKETYMKDKEVLMPYKPENPDEFFTTEAFTDEATNYLDKYGKSGNPFFLYVAYNAPHWPLQARPEDVEKYRGKYMKGWDVVSHERFKRQQQMGLVKPQWKLPPRDEQVDAWEDFKQKDAADLTMATYAAMIDQMDVNIGRILNKLKAIGAEDNTLVIFLSDNGACAEGKMWDGKDEKLRPGTKNSGAKLGIEWACAANTPYRKYKRSMFNGGQVTPFIARWPKGIKAKGEITFQKGNIVDLLPTFAELAGIKYPEGETWKVPDEGSLKTEWRIRPLSGKSLVPIFHDKIAEQPNIIMGHFQGGRMMIDGNKKLVSDGGDGAILHLYDYPWELYDLGSDGSETKNLASLNRAYIDSMDAIYRNWIDEMDALNGIKSHSQYQPHFTRQQREAANELEKDIRLQQILAERKKVGLLIIDELAQQNLKVETWLGMERIQISYYGHVVNGKKYQTKTERLKSLYEQWDALSSRAEICCIDKGALYADVWQLQERIRCKASAEELK